MNRNIWTSLLATPILCPCLAIITLSDASAQEQIFSPKVDYDAGDGPLSVVAADFDGDGIVDLAGTNRQSNDLAVFLGIGDGEFQAAGTFETGHGPWDALAADFDEDGYPDLAVTNEYHDSISILIGDDAGVFETAATLTVGDGPLGAVAADFDGDAHLDLAVGNYNSDDVWIFLGNGDGTFGAPDFFLKAFEALP